MAIILSIAVFFLGILAAFVSRQMADEFKAWTPWWLKHLLMIAVSRLPEDERERFSEEWQSHVTQVPGEIGKIMVALGCIIAACKIASSKRGAQAKSRNWKLIGKFLVQVTKPINKFFAQIITSIAIFCAGASIPYMISIVTGKSVTMPSRMSGLLGTVVWVGSEIILHVRKERLHKSSSKE
jgi:hypothetical protein